MTADPHTYAREHPPGGLYRVVRFVAGLVLRAWFRPRVAGAEHIPAEGPAIVVTNHKSFLDAFFVGLSTRRRVRFMAKAELFRGPLGPLFLRLGAFPVQRGAGDAASFETCLELLRHGELVVLFPEGTRVDDADAIAAPHHGAARLAAATGAPIVPGAIAGTARLWFGPVPRPRRVRLTFLAPVRADAADDPQALLDERIWPAVLDEYGRLHASRGLIAGALAGLGIGAGIAVARRHPRLIEKLGPRKARQRARRRRLLRRLRFPRA